MYIIYFIFDIFLISIFICSFVLNLISYLISKQAKELKISILMFTCFLNTIITFMAEYSYNNITINNYNIISYIQIRSICTIIITIIGLSFIVNDFLEKKFNTLQIFSIILFIIIIIYTGNNNSIYEHWLFYAIRQIYLLCFSLYYFIILNSTKNEDYKNKLKSYIPIMLYVSLFSFFIFVEDSVIMCNFQYVINILNFKILKEHNFSEDIFFCMIGLISMKNVFISLLYKSNSNSMNKIDNKLEKPVCKLPPIDQNFSFSTEYSLSSRQEDVLYLLLNGLSYQEISNSLGLSIGTVKFHVHGLYQKTESKNRSELILKYSNFNKNIKT